MHSPKCQALALEFFAVTQKIAFFRFPEDQLTVSQGHLNGIVLKANYNIHMNLSPPTAELWFIHHMVQKRHVEIMVMKIRV